MMFNPSALAHIRSLADHGAILGGSTPLTVSFCEEALAHMQQDSAAASYNYDMVLPSIDAEFMLVIHRDGSIDSGSSGTVTTLLRSR